ncbi:MAG: precorrin-6y C5,15-methyltransferase (decarboxylating) subunit CbiE [Pseudomonadota bacterium]
MEIKKTNIIIVGCGPGSPEYITPLALKAVKETEILVGARRLLALFPDHQAETIIEMGSHVETVLEEMARRQDRLMVVLVSGDPGLSSLARPVIKRFGLASCRVIPGISSIQVAFARLGLDWARSRIIDAHGQDPEADLQAIVHSGVETTAVLGGRQGSLEWLAKAFKDLAGEWGIYVLENLTLPDEKIRQVEPYDLEKLEVSSRTIFLIVKRDDLAKSKCAGPDVPGAEFQ